MQKGEEIGKPETCAKIIVLIPNCVFDIFFSARIRFVFKKIHFSLHEMIITNNHLPKKMKPIKPPCSVTFYYKNEYFIEL